MKHRPRKLVTNAVDLRVVPVGGRASKRPLKITVRKRRAAMAGLVPKNPQRADPSRTADMARAFGSRLNRAFAELCRRIADMVDRQDCFGLLLRNTEHDPETGRFMSGGGEKAFKTEKEAEQKFNEIADAITGRESRLSKQVRVITPDDRRVIQLSMGEVWNDETGEYTGHFKVRMDFDIRGETSDYQAETVQAGSKSLADMLKKLATAYHDAGFKIAFTAADERRRIAYGRILTRMGLKFEGETRCEDIWNSSQETFPAVLQRDDWDCGPAVLEALCRWLGRHCPPLDASTEHGTTPRAMMTALEAAGIDGQLRTGMVVGDLEPVTLCLVQHREPARYRNGHWVAVTQAGHGMVQVMDPAYGFRWMTAEAFEDGWHDEGWIRAGITVSRVTANEFCPTGPGGGVDPSCGKHNADLPDTARPAVDAATAKFLNNYSWGYDEEMNRSLRMAGEPPPGQYGSSKEGKATVDGPAMFKAIHEVLAKVQPFKDPVEVKRGIFVSDDRQRERLVEAAERALESGGTVTMPGFVSTTTGDLDVSRNITFRIEAVHGLDMVPHSRFPQEKELLLDHNSRFIVVEVEKGRYKSTITLRQLPPGGPMDGVKLTGNAGKDGSEAEAWIASMTVAHHDAAAAQADPSPTAAQREASNYRCGHVTVQGLDITIETAKGVKRKPHHERPLAVHYGYVRSSEGADGDHVDVFLGPDPGADTVYIVDQLRSGVENAQARDERGRWVISQASQDLPEFQGGFKALKVEARHPNTGERVGRATFLVMGDKEVYPDHVGVERAHQRKGVATAMYEHMLAQGYKIERQDALTDSGRAFRESFDSRHETRNSSKQFDEHKCMVGFPSEAAARAAYLASYPDGWGGLGGVTAVPMVEFKQWLAEGDTSRPAAEWLGDKQVDFLARWLVEQLTERVTANAQERDERGRFGHASEEAGKPGSRKHRISRQLTLYKRNDESPYELKHSKDGDKADISVERDGDELHFSDIRTPDGMSAVSVGTLGPKVVRRVLRAIISDHPGVTKITGTRAFGRLRGGQKTELRINELLCNCGGKGGTMGPCPKGVEFSRLEKAKAAVDYWQAKAGGALTAFIDRLPLGKATRELLEKLNGKLKARYGEKTMRRIVLAANALSWGAFLGGAAVGAFVYLPASGLMAIGAALAEAGVQGMKAYHAVTGNTAFAFHSSPERIKAFQRWLQTQVDQLLGDEDVWARYVEEGYRKGAARAFVGKPRGEFLRGSFGQPVAVERIKVLAGRAFDEMKNVTNDMATRISRTLGDGLVQGKHPKQIAKDLAAETGLSLRRANLVAQTEIVRANAVGQLDAFKAQGMDRVGVQAEFRSAQDGVVCPKCAALDGQVFDIDAAYGLIPAHPGCRCAFIPHVGRAAGATPKARAVYVKGRGWITNSGRRFYQWPVRNTEQLRDELGRFAGGDTNYQRKLTAGERRTVALFTGSDTFSRDVNSALRQGLVQKGSREDGIIRAMDSVIRKAGSFPERLTLFRGVGHTSDRDIEKTVEEARAAIRDGGSITMKEFVSTTPEESKANEWVGSRQYTTLPGVVYKIEADRGAYVGNLNPEETYIAYHEVILPRGQSYSVKGVQEKDGRTVIHVVQEPYTSNVFCPTGAGGGVDATCGKHASVRSAAFKAWFGDWENGEGSRVTNSAGEPKETWHMPVAVFHGTAHGGWTVPDASKLAPADELLYGRGFYFTEDRGVAQEYVEKGEDPGKLVLVEDTAAVDLAPRFAEVAADLKARSAALGPRVSKLGDDKRRWIHIMVEGMTEGGRRKWLADFPLSDPADMAARAGRMKGQTPGWSEARAAEWRGLAEGEEKLRDERAALNASAGMLREMSGALGRSSGGANAVLASGMKGLFTAAEVADAAKHLRAAGIGVSHIQVPMAKEVKECYLNIRRPFRADEPMGRAEAVKLLGEEGTAAISRSGKLIDGVYEAMVKAGGKAAATERLRAAGYDGITHEGGHVYGTKKHRVWIAFEPTQIKSVENRGTFDPKDSSILNRDQARDQRGRWVSQGGEVLHRRGRAVPPHIRALAIPPSWTDVYINRDPGGDLLARGKDSKGREQKRYSGAHEARQAIAKFRRVRKYLKERDGMLAELGHSDTDEALRVVMLTGARPGSEKDTGAEHRSYGVTTLEARHVLEGGRLLRFVAGKHGGKPVEFCVEDERVAAMLAERAKRGGRLFDTSAGKLQERSRGLDGGGLHPKDARTAIGTETAAEEVARRGRPATEAARRRAIMEVAAKVAGRLGNTPAVALKSYIDPSVFERWR